MEPEVDTQVPGQPDFFVEALKRFNRVTKAEKDMRDQALEDLKFSLGDSDNGWQWDEDDVDSRGDVGAPSLTINVCQQAVRHVTNEQRQSRPQIRFHPVDDKADVDTAHILDGVARHIQQHSDAEIAYDTACEYQTRAGFGWFRIVTEWCDERSFDKDILIRRIENPFAVYADPDARLPDKSDMRWLFYASDFSRDAFTARFGNKATEAYQTGSTLHGTGDMEAGWISENSIRVVEYWRVIETAVTLWRLSDGRVFSSEDTTLEDLTMLSAFSNTAVADERPAVSRRIRMYLMTSREVLEETDWEGRYIPFVRIAGEELNVDGDMHTAGLVRNAKDAQRMYNFHSSNETWSIATAPRTKMAVEAGQIEDFSDEWENLNDPTQAIVRYRARAIEGTNQPVPPPLPLNNDAQIQGLAIARGQAYEDVQRSLAMHEASFGERSNEKSGRAIRERREAGGTATFHYTDNLARGMRYAGRILLDLIPKVYAPMRIAQILGEDGTPDRAMLINSRAGGTPPAELPDGIRRVYDVGVGKYDVAVVVGPSYATKRLEASDHLLALAKADPTLLEWGGDLVYQSLDFPYAQELADRKRKMLAPTGLIDDDDNPQPVPPEVQMQIQQMEQALEDAMEQLDAFKSKRLEMETKVRMKREELASEERRQALKGRIDIAEALIRTGSSESIALLEQEVQGLRDLMDIEAAMASHEGAGGRT